MNATGHVHDLLAYRRDLDADERRRVSQHLRACAECRTTWEAYQRQDAALSTLPELRPRPSLHPASAERSGPTVSRLSPPRRALAHFGDGLVLVGIAFLAWFTVHQRELAVRSATSAADLLGRPGLALPATSLHAVSPWLGALPWLGASCLLVGGLFVLTRRSLIPTIVGALIAGVLLVTFVPPISALPNPAGLYWRVAGGYGYDPHLPFKNDFLIAGRPEKQLAPYLDRLIGQIGLSPLDPVHPLASYEILRVGLHPVHKDIALVTTRFLYADGSSRVYPVPLAVPVPNIAGFWLGLWRHHGLERLFSEHLALLDVPFAGPDAPIRLGQVRLTAVHPAAQRLDEANPGHWLWQSVRVQRLVWAPDGRSFLAAVEVDPGVRQLWQVPLDGSPPRRVGTQADVREYGWSPDGRTVVFTQDDPAAAVLNPLQSYAIMAASADRPEAARVLATGLRSEKLPGLTADGAWFFDREALWVAPYDGAPARLVRADLVDRDPDLPPRPSPDGTRVAYVCGAQLRVLDINDSVSNLRVDRRAAELAWAPDGSRMALVDRDPNGRYAVRLVVLSQIGREEFVQPIALREATEDPQWTPDGQAVFVQTYPQDGRRILALDLPTGRTLDLSREHWDAYFALSPDGKTLLLNNGRGDFWLADVVR